MATPGNATDFAFIGREILDLAARYDLREVAYDRTFAGEIVQTLQEEGLNLVQYGQGFLSLAAPTAELERLCVSRTLWHGGHPVLRWNASSVAVRRDPAGNIKPDKERSATSARSDARRSRAPASRQAPGRFTAGLPVTISVRRALAGTR